MTKWILILALACGLVLAQGPMAGGPANATFDAVKAALNLTDAQITQLKAIKQQQIAAVQSLQQQVAEKHKLIADEMAKTSPSAAVVGQAMVDIHNLQKQIQTTAEGFVTQAVALLTAEQKTKLKALEDAAKLRPAIQEAIALELLPPAVGGAGPGAGLGMVQGMGPGAGQGMRPGMGQGMGPGMGRNMARPGIR